MPYTVSKSAEYSIELAGLSTEIKSGPMPSPLLRIKRGIFSSRHDARYGRLNPFQFVGYFLYP
jgi:hypothetical protein